MIDRHRVLRAGVWALTAPLPAGLRRRKRQAWRAELDNRRVLAADHVVLSRAKSGRTWLRAMLSRLYQQRFGIPAQQLLEYDNYHRFHRDAPVVAFTHGHGLDKVTNDARRRARLQGQPLVFLIRDPRDVAVSEYFQSTRRAAAYKRSLYGVEEYGRMLDFLLRSPLGVAAVCDYLNRWHRTFEGWPRVRVVRYESLRADPHRELAALCAFLGEPCSDDEIREAVEFASFESLQRKEREDYFNNGRLRARNADDPDSFKVRRGKVGGWRDYFEPEEAVRVAALVAERLDPALGYR